LIPSPLPGLELALELVALDGPKEESRSEKASGPALLALGADAG
jgi:hypothetical protein